MCLPYFLSLTKAFNSITLVTIWCISVATCCLYSTSWWYLGACTQLGKAGAYCQHIKTRIPKEVYQVEKLGNTYILKSECLVFSLTWLRGSMAGGSVLLLSCHCWHAKMIGPYRHKTKTCGPVISVLCRREHGLRTPNSKNLG